MRPRKTKGLKLCFTGLRATARGGNEVKQRLVGACLTLPPKMLLMIVKLSKYNNHVRPSRIASKTAPPAP